mgnify:FL=1
MTDTMEADQLGHGKMTVSKRLALLENDREQQSRVLTELIQKVQASHLTPEQLTEIVRSAVREQLTQIVRSAVQEEMADSGLRLDGEIHQDAAKEDFRFLRNLRKTWDGAVSKIGNAVLIAVVAIVGTIFGLGFWAWISRGSGQ